MIEVCLSYNLLPGVDPEEYKKIAKDEIDYLMKTPGFVEVRNHLNLLGSPQARTTYVWESMVDWARCNENAVISGEDAKLYDVMTNIKVEAWVTSPDMPEPIRK